MERRCGPAAPSIVVAVMGVRRRVGVSVVVVLRPRPGAPRVCPPRGAAGHLVLGESPRHTSPLFLHPRKRCCIPSPAAAAAAASPDLRSAHSARVGHLEGFTQIWPQFQTLRASATSPTHPTGRTLKSSEESRPQKCDLSPRKAISIDYDGDDDGRRSEEGQSWSQM